MTDTKNRFQAYTRETDSTFAEVKSRLDEEAANKAWAILSILMIGDNRSSAYCKAILSAVEVALENMTTFARPRD